MRTVIGVMGSGGPLDGAARAAAREIGVLIARRAECLPRRRHQNGDGRCEKRDQRAVERCGHRAAGRAGHAVRGRARTQERQDGDLSWLGPRRRHARWGLRAAAVRTDRRRGDCARRARGSLRFIQPAQAWVPLGTRIGPLGTILCWTCSPHWRFWVALGIMRKSVAEGRRSWGGFRGFHDDYTARGLRRPADVRTGSTSIRHVAVHPGSLRSG